jgi:hypothetical protein
MAFLLNLSGICPAEIAICPMREDLSTSDTLQFYPIRFHPQEATSPTSNFQD